MKTKQAWNKHVSYHYLKGGVCNILICGFWYTRCMSCIEMLGLHWVWFVSLCMHSILCILCRFDPPKERVNLETCDPQGAIVETCDLWDIWLESTCDLINQPSYLPIFMNTHLHYNPFTSLRGVILETFIRVMRRYIAWSTNDKAMTCDCFENVDISDNWEHKFQMPNYL